MKQQQQQQQQNTAGNPAVARLPPSAHPLPIRIRLRPSAADPLLLLPIRVHLRPSAADLLLLLPIRVHPRPSAADPLLLLPILVPSASIRVHLRLRRCFAVLRSCGSPGF
jgi:hypothetical protein